MIGEVDDIGVWMRWVSRIVVWAHDDEFGRWSFNDMVRVVADEAASCTECAEWDQRYMVAALRKDPSLWQVEDQCSAALTGPLLGGLTTLRGNYGSSCGDNAATMVHLGEELETRRRQLASASATIYGLGDTREAARISGERTIKGMEEHMDDVERGNTPCRGKAPGDGWCSG